MKKGNPISVKASLKNISSSKDVKYQYVITRYFHERLLYRIANSIYANNFFLKGGALLYAIEGLFVRPTVDIDMLAQYVSNDKEQVKQIFRTICSAEYNDDCVVFFVDTIETLDISEDDKYSGVRVLIWVGLDTIRQRLQVDIGFSDIITPAPVCLTYPVLLDEFATPKIQAYSIETMIAEKFQAMITLGTFNSRMKDFYDVYLLIKNNDIKDKCLKDAIFQTFKHRRTVFVKEHELFHESFYKEQNRQIMWSAFLSKMNIRDKIEFPHIMKSVLEKLKPIYDELV